MKILWIIFGVITKFDYFWRSFLCILESFLKVSVQNVNILGVTKIINIFGYAWYS